MMKRLFWIVLLAGCGNHSPPPEKTIPPAPRVFSQVSLPVYAGDNLAVPLVVKSTGPVIVAKWMIYSTKRLELHEVHIDSSFERVPFAAVEVAQMYNGQQIGYSVYGTSARPFPVWEIPPSSIAGNLFGAILAGNESLLITVRIDSSTLANKDTILSLLALKVSINNGQPEVIHYSNLPARHVLFR